MDFNIFSLQVRLQVFKLKKSFANKKILNISILQTKPFAGSFAGF